MTTTVHQVDVFKKKDPFGFLDPTYNPFANQQPAAPTTDPIQTNVTVPITDPNSTSDQSSDVNQGTSSTDVTSSATDDQNTTISNSETPPPSDQTGDQTSSTDNGLTNAGVQTTATDNGTTETDGSVPTTDNNGDTPTTDDTTTPDACKNPEQAELGCPNTTPNPDLTCAEGDTSCEIKPVCSELTCIVSPTNTTDNSTLALNGTIPADLHMPLTNFGIGLIIVGVFLTPILFFIFGKLLEKRYKYQKAEKKDLKVHPIFAEDQPVIPTDQEKNLPPESSRQPLQSEIDQTGAQTDRNLLQTARSTTDLNSNVQAKRKSFTINTKDFEFNQARPDSILPVKTTTISKRPTDKELTEAAATHKSPRRKQPIFVAATFQPNNPDGKRKKHSSQPRIRPVIHEGESRQNQFSQLKVKTANVQNQRSQPLKSLFSPRKIPLAFEEQQLDPNENKNDQKQLNYLKPELQKKRKFNKAMSEQIMPEVEI